ncbi:MAG: carbohydrate-binding protein, partial [Rubrivivax sp.]
MGRRVWRHLWPSAPQAALAMLGGDGGPVEPPIRAEIFGPQRFAQHGHSLAATHEAAPAGWRSAAFFPRLADNVRQLRAAHHYIVAQAAAGYDVSPAAEWLLDNFHLIETQLERIHLELPRRTVRALPVLLSPPLAGLPRIYGVAWAFVAHTDGAFDEDLLVHYLGAYQEVRDLSLAEMWALPTTLRVLLLENLRRLAEREAGFASTFPDSLESSLDITPPADELADAAMVDALRAWLRPLQQRGVGTVFLARLSQRLLEQPVPAAVRHWLDQALPDPAVVQAQQGADQAADNLSMSNAVNSLRAIGDADWADLVARASVLMRLMLSTPLFEAEQAGTRDQTLHAIEGLARRSGRSELAVARVLLGLMQAAQPARDTAAETPPGTEPSRTPGHWLHGAGRPALTQALGLHEPLAGLWRHI